MVQSLPTEYVIGHIVLVMIVSENTYAGKQNQKETLKQPS